MVNGITISGGRCEDSYDGAEKTSGRREGGQTLQVHHTLRVSHGKYLIDYRVLLLGPYRS